VGVSEFSYLRCLHSSQSLSFLSQPPQQVQRHLETTSAQTQVSGHTSATLTETQKNEYVVLTEPKNGQVGVIWLKAFFELLFHSKLGFHPLFCSRWREMSDNKNN